MCNKLFWLLLYFVLGDGSVCLSQCLPIKPARTISFTTDEGSYIDVDISPNGKTLVFDLLGDLYIVPVSGGQAKQLTRGLAYNRYPTWSPDGRQIAFISDASGANRLEIMNVDGSRERALDLTQKELIKPDNGVKIQAMPSWSPDGQYIVAGDQLYALAGGNMTLPRDLKCNVQFSKDGRFLYADEDGKDVEHVLRYSRLTGKTTELAKVPLSIMTGNNSVPGIGWNENQVVSPNGEWLAYVDGSRDPQSDLRVRNLATGKDFLLAPAIEQHHRNFVEHFSFAPDSHSILIGFRGKLHRIEIENGLDEIIPFKANVKADLGAFDYNTFRINDDSLQVRLIHSANASPDGKSLVFSALDRIYTMQMPNGTPHILVKQSCGQFQPVYSPDGKWIAYVSWSDTEGGYVWRVPVAGGKPEKLALNEGYYHGIAWSPDSRFLATVVRDGPPVGGSYGGPVGKVEIVEIATKTSQKIADSITMQGPISFTNDGRNIITRVGGLVVDKHSRLTLISIENGQRHALTALDIGQLVFNGFMTLQQVTISPDQRFVVYGINEDLYLAPLPNLGVPAVLNSATGIKPIIRFAVGGYDPHWEQGGKILAWSHANRYYRISPNKILQVAAAAAIDSTNNSLKDNGFYKTTIVPDQTITINLKAVKQYPKGTIALRNARVISMKGDNVVEKGTIVIRNGRIVAVGPTIAIAIPRGANVFDLSGKTVMPGIIDLHDHVGAPMGVFPQQYWRYLVNLAYGVTTARNPSAGFDEFAYSELLQSGQMIGPRLFSVGYSVGEGHLIVDNLDDAREAIQKRQTEGATVIKQYMQETRLQRQWVLMACKEYGLNMTNEGDFDPREELAMIKDGSTGVEHAYGWGNVYQDVIHFVAASGTWHTPTLIVCSDGAEQYFRNLFRQNPDKKLNRYWPATGNGSYEDLMKPQSEVPNQVKSDIAYTSSIEAKIYKRGGHIGLGGHGNDPGIISQWELWALQMGGLTNMEALKVATISGAEALGMQQDLGSIEPGKIADLIILDKNPLEDIHNTMSIHYVMKSGILYEGNTLDEVWPEHKKCPKWQLDPKYVTNKKQ